MGFAPNAVQFLEDAYEEGQKDRIDYVEKTVSDYEKALKHKADNGCCVSSDDSRQAVAGQWSGETEQFAQDGELQETSALDAFLEHARLNTFTVSGMVFQDAWNLDLQRLQRCYICEMDSRHGMVPFCAYNLTDAEGRALYRE